MSAPEERAQLLSQTVFSGAVEVLRPTINQLVDTPSSPGWKSSPNFEKRMTALKFR
jgi:hypothetical protein